MRRIERVHRTNHTKIIGHGGELWQQVADLHATLSVLLEFEGRLQQATCGPLGPQVDCACALTLVFLEGWLVVEHIQLRWPTLHEQHDDVLCRGRQRRTGIPPCRGGRFERLTRKNARETNETCPSTKG